MGASNSEFVYISATTGRGPRSFYGLWWYWRKGGAEVTEEEEEEGEKMNISSAHICNLCHR
jgi:hypothetical protein